MTVQYNIPRLTTWYGTCLCRGKQNLNIQRLNCDELTDDTQLLRQSDAVILHGRDMPSELPRQRSTNQRWVYVIQENSHYTTPEPSKYNGVFNWTMTYKRSSDIWAPYGSYRKKNIDDRKNYNSGITDEQQKTFLRVVRNAVNNWFLDWMFWKLP